jgi:hypothetical protein
MAELSLWLDSYDDVYSDFDSRNYSKRRISEDFVDELKIATKYRTEKPNDLLLVLPHNKRKEEVEPEIGSSLKEEINKRLAILRNNATHIYRKGIQLLFLGTLLLFGSSFIVYKSYQSYWFILPRVVLEPAGWFMIWNGLESLFYKFKDIQKDISFYETVANMKIHFKTE